ncbi:MAG: tetratricopeptide repeat protein [Bryobacteraceae bacterium]
MSAQSQTNSASTNRVPILASVAMIVLVIAALAAIDVFLAKTEQAELQNEAQQFYLDGSRLLEESKATQAVDRLRRAHALARQNPDYELELINALMAAGKLGEAEPLMNDTLQREPNDGRANLTAARLMKKERRTTDAEAYYHRAIYGEWPSDAATHRISARMELVDFLVAHGKKQELLAELLPLQEEAGENPAIEKRVAHLFLVAGSASRSAEVYHSLIQQNPRDVEAYAGLGEAELAQGRYRAAKAAFITAFMHRSNDVSLRQRMQLANMMTTLDPTPRELSLVEKYRRDLRILDLSRASLEHCITSYANAGSNETQELLGGAQAALSPKTRARVTDELAEETLDLAEKIWQARIKACGTNTSPGEEPLRLLMERLSR